MTNPKPKTKYEEMADFINGLMPNEVLSEFKYARARKILKSLENIIPEDEYLIFDAIIEVFNNNLLGAYEKAQQASVVSEKILVLDNVLYVYEKVFSLYDSVQVLNKKAVIGKKLGKSLKESVVDDVELVLTISGKIKEIEFEIEELSEHQKINIKRLQTSLNALDMHNEDLYALMKIIHNLLILKNTRCLYTEYCGLQEDLLILIYVDAPIEHIALLNDLLFEECYCKDLLEPLNKISYSFVPFEGK